MQSLADVYEGWITSIPNPRFLMHKFSFVLAIGSFCSNCLFYFWWLNNNLAAVPCCVYHMLLWFMGSFNWILLFPGKQGNPLHCSATLPIYPVCAKMHADGFVFEIHLAVPKYNSTRQWSAENQNLDREMQSNICYTELHGQGRIHAFNSCSALGEFKQERGASVFCARRQESAMSMWTDGWIITKIAHKLLAFCWQWSGQREKALWRVACNYHGSLPRLGWTLTQPST